MIRGSNYRRSLAGKKVLVVGLGKSGKAAVKALNDAGAIVSIQDASTADKLDTQFLQYIQNEEMRTFLGTEPDDVTAYEMFVMSPGVPTDLPFIQEAIKKNVEVIGEIELAYRISESNFVAITGTNGKTTTTSLVGQIFEAAGRNTSVVGNIGNPVIAEAADAKEDHWMITEVSSFQLETIKEFRPHVSAILNITPDHLNRHKTMEAYEATKARITENQTKDDYFVYNMDDSIVGNIALGSKATTVPFSINGEIRAGAYVDDTSIIVKGIDGSKHLICDSSDLRIIGTHNIENVLAASAICYFAGIEVSAIAQGIRNFAGVEHRIEFCGRVDDVDYYNDSKGTNTDAAIIALKALENNIILIAGGDGKQQDFSELAAMFEGRVKSLILLGRDAQIIEDAARAKGFENIYRCKDMPECVRKAAEIAKPDDKVLLSPACASWDMYDNFEQRGRHFKNCIKELLR